MYKLDLEKAEEPEIKLPTSHQDSMVLAQRQKHRSMEQDGKPRGKSTNL